MSAAADGRSPRQRRGPSIHAIYLVAFGTSSGYRVSAMTGWMGDAIARWRGTGGMERRFGLSGACKVLAIDVRR